MAKMTDDELLARVDAESKAALGPNTSDLSKDRERAIEYYNGKLDVNAPEGRSSVVSTDVRDAIDGMLPDLLDIFLSSDDVVKFEPQGPEDEQAAKQATDTANYIFHRQNPGALILYEWFKAAMMEKNSIVKFYHDAYSTPKIETYEGLNDLEFQALIQNPTTEVSVLEHSASPDPLAQGMSLHDVTVRVLEKGGKICIKGVPSDEWRVSGDHASLCLYDCRFIEHERRMSISDIRAMGYDIPDDISDSYSNDQDGPEWNARRRYEEERNARDKVSDKASREVRIAEASMLVDVDGDGYAERRKIVRIGRTILANDYDDIVPFAAICPVIMPYRFSGLSIADLVMDIQQRKSITLRSVYDSMYFALNPRIGVTENQVNLDDLLVSRPGGVVRFKGPPGQLWQPIEHRFLGQQAMPMIEYEDNVKENRTGWTRYSQGLDADSLNKTATGVSIITNSAQKRMKLIARMFAETGVKDLFRGIMHLAHKHNAKPMTIRLRNQWVEVDPRQFKTGWDMSVNVGLGTGDKTSQQQQLSGVMQVQNGLLQMGKGHLVTDQNIFNAAKRLSETAGFKQEGEFFTAPDPNNPPPEPPPPPEIIKIQQDGQLEQARLQSEEKKKLAEIQNGQQVTQMQSQTQIEVAKIKAATDERIALAEIQAKERLESMKLQQESERLLFETRAQAENGAVEHQRELEKTAATPDAKVSESIKQVADMLQQSLAELMEIKAELGTEIEFVRDEQGNLRGTKERGTNRMLRELVRDKTGRPVGARKAKQPVRH